MRLYIDVESQKLVEVAGSRRELASVSFKRGDSARVEVQFVSGTTVQELSGTTITGTFALKESGKYDTATAIVGPASWSKEGTGTSTIYVFTPSFNTTALNTLLAHGDGNDANDVASVTLMGEISWTIDGAVYSTQQFAAVVANDVIKGSEGPAVDVPAEQIDWLAANGIVYDPAITGLTGGGATKLDGIVTADADVGRLQAMVIAGAISIYQLQSGTSAESSPFVIRPDDYASSTNEKIWVPATIAFLATSTSGVAVSGSSTGSSGIGLQGQALASGAIAIDGSGGSAGAILLKLSDTTLGDVMQVDQGGACTLNSTFAQNFRAALGIPTYADLTAANAALNAGDIYYDTALGVLRAATA